MPLVSIVLPTHNGSKYLALAIDSVLAQTYRDFELIIVDDGSTDNTGEIISRYADMDKRVKAVHHDVNKYLPAALNTGFKAATGDLFTWTSDDNILKPQMIERFVQVFSSRPEVDIVYADCDFIDENGTKVGTMVTGPDNELPILDNIGASFMYRRKVDEVCGGYDESAFCAEDYAFWLKAYYSRFCFYRLEVNLYQYRFQDNSISRQRRDTVLHATLRVMTEINEQNADKMPELIRMRSYLRCLSLAKELDNPSLALEYLQRARSVRANADDWTRPMLIRYATGNSSTQKRVILFGAGEAGRAALKWMRENGIAVSAFVDNNEALWYHEIEGLPVLNPAFLEYLESPQVLITAAYPAISSQLSSMGIENHSAFYLFHAKYLKNKNGVKAQSTPSTQRALNWVFSNMAGGGLNISTQEQQPYPEVTGYTIPTLVDYGFADKAIEMAEYLVSVQCESGEFCAPGSDIAYFFDTAQALRGLLAVEKYTNRFHANTAKAAEWLFTTLKENNGCPPIAYYDAPIIPEAINLFALPPMLEYAKRISSDEYISLVKTCAEKLSRTSDALSLTTITHFLAYQIDGLIDIGMADIAKPVLEQLAATQSKDGFIPARQGAAWTILTGCAQLAICYYKLGNTACANRLMAYLDSVQETNGGFYGSLEDGAQYFQDTQISWAAKFYLDAQRERVRAFFNDNVGIFPAQIAPDDGRVYAISAEIKDGDSVLEAGCGKGRIVRCLMERYPKSSFTALDLSSAMLDFVPEGAVTVEGALESIPLPDNTYDVTYSVEAIEHSANPAAVVRELVRVTKKGGCIIIIDKQAAEWGRMECPPWESWPERKVLESLLSKYCMSVKSEPVGYDISDKNDDLMIKWVGIKRG